MEFPRDGEEERSGIWLPEKPMNDQRLQSCLSTTGSQKLTSPAYEGLQASESRLPCCRAIDTTHGEAFARVTPSRDALVHYADGLTRETFKICKEFLRPFKKCLRKLNLPKDFPEEKRMSCTRRNLIILGDHINRFLQHYCKKWEMKHWKKMLWRFVSLFSALDEKQLCKLYHYGKTDQTAKFLKAYCHLEKSSPVALPENSRLMSLRDTWGLRGGTERQENLNPIRSLSPSCEQPAGSRPRKRSGQKEDLDALAQLQGICTRTAKFA